MVSKQVFSSEGGKVFNDTLDSLNHKLVNDLFDTKFLTSTAAFIFFKNPNATSTFFSGILNTFDSNHASAGAVSVINSWLKGFDGKQTILSWKTNSLTIDNSCISAGVVKLLLGILTGSVTNFETAASTFSAGASKEYIKSVSTDLLNKKILENAYLKTLANNSKSKLNVIKNVFNKVDFNDVKLRKNKGFTKLFWKNMRFTQVELGVGVGIDYIASVASTAIGQLVSTGTINVSDLKLGQNLLVSAYKTTFAIAFEKMFTFAGPAGQKFGKQLGTIVGASIGNFWVEAFNKDEDWCVKAGLATVAGAVGGIWAGAAIAAAVSASVPVAGWIVGGAIIVGATVATAVTYLFYWFSGGG